MNMDIFYTTSNDFCFYNDVSLRWCHQVNNVSMQGKTREEAVLIMLGLHEQVNMMVQYRPEGISHVSLTSCKSKLLK